MEDNNDDDVNTDEQVFTSEITLTSIKHEDEEKKKKK